MGPNNARHVVWAISKLIYFLSCLIYTNNYIQVLFYIFKGFGKVAVQEMGPNNARRFFFLLSFINTNYIQIGMGWFREGSDDENGFKNKLSVIEYSLQSSNTLF